LDAGGGKKGKLSKKKLKRGKGKKKRRNETLRGIGEQRPEGGGCPQIQGDRIPGKGWSNWNMGAATGGEGFPGPAVGRKGEIIRVRGKN